MAGFYSTAARACFGTVIWLWLGRKRTGKVREKAVHEAVSQHLQWYISDVLSTPYNFLQTTQHHWVGRIPRRKSRNMEIHVHLINGQPFSEHDGEGKQLMTWTLRRWIPHGNAEWEVKRNSYEQKPRSLWYKSRQTRDWSVEKSAWTLRWSNYEEFYAVKRTSPCFGQVGHICKLFK